MVNKQDPHPKCCAICGRFFRPDRRQGDKQKSCPRAQCRKERKRRSQKAWTAQNPAYFQGRYENTKLWRRQNPAYQKQWRRKRREIQDAIGDVSPLRTVRILVPVKSLLGEIQDTIWMEESCTCGVMAMGWGMQDTRHDRIFVRDG